MRRRSLYVFLCYGVALSLLVPACSGPPRGKLEIPKARSGDSVAVGLELSEGSYAIGEEVVMTLVVSNLTADTLQLGFPSAQRHDFLVRKDRRIIWQWSRNMAFAQVTGDLLITPHDSVEYTIAWDQNTAEGVNPGLGRYTAQGILMTAPVIATDEVPFGIVD
jgi:hypothetical protein